MLLIRSCHSVVDAFIIDLAIYLCIFIFVVAILLTLLKV